MKILITGANGYIGAHVVKAFAEAKCERIVAVDLIANSLAIDGVEYITLDLLSEANNGDLYRLLGAPDVIVHLAWQDGFKHNSDAHFRNLGAHYEFLKNMVNAGCRNITVMGSMHEVGYYRGCISDETPPPCEPMNPYGIAKNALRQAMFALCRDKPQISLKWLRGYYITGDEDRASSIFAKISQMEKEGRTSFPFTDGRAKYDFVEVDKLAKMIVVAAMHTGFQEIINVCSGKPVSLGEKIESFLKEKSFKIRPEYGKFPMRSYDSPCIYGSNEKIKRLMEEKNL